MLNNINTEITANDLAERANVPLKNISGLLSKDIQKGKIMVRKDGGRNFYQVATVEAIPAKGLAPESTDIQATCRTLQLMGDETQTVTLPTIASIERKMEEARVEFKRLNELKDVLVRLEKITGANVLKGASL
ncbi:hypothetical protein I2492_04075 [Budviciaceae bacterium CWB-B4]|uniref:DNA-binding protein n=1 Tax=Limnobaculum xujianqingii TaxID=2738837 RepID=A0A9D7AGC4_9GAMM|nr:hypothetical protein [Limnobaculum xujianqingii]MBK5072192.1 hypothetical protein [Limnobaculum xujianqingii]MBK5175501.1 hypothetical protein [Limnobaculum xujianqingii]